MGDRQLRRRFTARSNPLLSTAEGQTSHRSTQSGPMIRALASPFGILAVFPGLVVLLGAFLTWMAQSALRGSNLELAQSRMSDQAGLVAEHLGTALRQADPMLAALRSFVGTIDSESPPDAVAFALRHLIEGRPGTSYVSLSFPDGTFEGAFVDEDQVLRFQVSRLLENRTEERVYDYVEGERLELRQVRSSRYDPRARPFYKLAAQNQDPVWTEPYPFARTGDTGVTRALAVRTRGKLSAVLTIDFDIRRLSPLLVRREMSFERPILFDDRGTLLADPQFNAIRSGEKILRLPSQETTNDPVLTAFFQHLPDEKDREFFSFATPEGPELASIVPLRGDGIPNWSVAFLAPEKLFLASLESYKFRSSTIALIAVVLATALSWVFARLVVRVRKEASEARRAARRATQEARELGSYRLVERLGVGGMGEVWRAEHRLLARQAAIKLIKQDEGASGSPVAQERFRREAQSLASLRSRNTIEILDYGVAEDGTFFYVMELLDGVDLENLVNRYGPQPPTRVVQLLVQVCRSLGEAHDAGLVHRDIKPANIFVCRVADEYDVVKVLDFGLVRTVASTSVDSATEDRVRSVDLNFKNEEELAGGSNLTKADHVMGTPDFIAPEQALGQTVDGRADLYALGCVAFWLLTGRTVFSGKSLYTQLSQHITEPAPRLEQFVGPEVPAHLCQVISDCLQKSPDARPPSAAALRATLTEIGQEMASSWEQEAGPWWSRNIPMRLGAETPPSRSRAEDDMASARTIEARPTEPFSVVESD